MSLLSAIIVSIDVMPLRKQKNTAIRKMQPPKAEKFLHFLWYPSGCIHVDRRLSLLCSGM